MKSMFQKLQTLGEKAAQIRQVVESAPGKVAQVRESLQLTAGQLYQARTELQQVATGLHVENDEDFTNAFREITENAAIFNRAGYDLAGVDLEVSHGQRLIVHLQRLAAVPEPTLRYILTENHALVTVYSILSSIIKAEALSQKVTAPNMEYSGLIVHLGAVPAVRISWRELNQEVLVAAPSPVRIASTSTSAPSAANTPPPTSSFAQSNFFGANAPRATAPAVPVPEPNSQSTYVPEAPTPSRAHFSSSKSLQGDWKKDALERLKSSPGVSKYQR